MVNNVVKHRHEVLEMFPLLKVMLLDGCNKSKHFCKGVVDA